MHNIVRIKSRTPIHSDAFRHHWKAKRVGGKIRKWFDIHNIVQKKLVLINSFMKHVSIKLHTVGLHWMLSGNLMISISSSSEVKIETNNRSGLKKISMNGTKIYPQTLLTHLGTLKDEGYPSSGAHCALWRKWNIAQWKKKYIVSQQTWCSKRNATQSFPT